MSNRASNWFVILASVGIAVPLSWLLQKPQQAGTAPEPAIPVDPARIAALEARVEGLVQQLAATAPASPVRTHAPADVPPAENRLRGLELRLSSLEQALRARPPSGAESRGHEPAENRPTVADARRVIVDPAASVAAKLEAQQRLRRVENAFTPAMLRELVRIGTTNPDPKVRADVWRFFDGPTNYPEIVDPLMRAMRFDSADVARDEAAETLGNYASNPAVRQALAHAAEHDPSVRVRNKAQRAFVQVLRPGDLMRSRLQDRR